MTAGIHVSADLFADDFARAAVTFRLARTLAGDRSRPSKRAILPDQVIDRRDRVHAGFQLLPKLLLLSLSAIFG